MERLFVVIGRINSVLLLLVLIGATASAIWLIIGENLWQQRGAVEVSDTESGEEKPILLSFGNVESIASANTLMISLTARGGSSKFSSGAYEGEIRNVLFLTGTEKAARWLFKEHRNLIIVATQLYEKRVPPDESPTNALYFEFIPADTDGDGRLSYTDDSSIGLANPDGTGFVVVLHDVAKVLAYDMLDAQHLSVIYQKGAVMRHAKFVVSTMELATDQEIATVPSEL